MIKRIKYLVMAICVLMVLYAFGEDGWKINPNESIVSFTARSIFGRVHGKIPGINATIIFNEKDLKGSSFKASIDPHHLDTDNGKRDRDLKSSRFLDVEKYPQIKFLSKNISKTQTGYSVIGDLTIKDVTKEITFPFTFENQSNKGIFRGAFSINRRDYHVGGKTKLAGDNIDLEVVTVVEKQIADKMD